jgi:hypothetical protein
MALNMKLALDYDVADGITLLTLKDHRKMIKDQVKKHLKKGEYMHAEDLAFNQTKLLPALDILIHHYGG